MGAVLAMLSVGMIALGAEPQAPALSDDPVVARLVEAALQQRPELAQVKERIAAEGHRVPQASAMPEPMLAVGIQNDGFRGLQIGTMPTSFVSLMLSQTIPFWGKRGLRREVAALGVDLAGADLRRLELTVTADVERAYLDLLMIRDQRVLLGKLDGLWQQAVGLAQVRYEGGDGAQSDLLRAQLERSRLAQRRYILDAEERRRLAVLNRLRGRPLDEPLATSRSLADLPEAAPAQPGGASPEEARAELLANQAARRAALARRELAPDVTVTLGLMPRGSLDPMWLATVGVPLPVWAADRQLPAEAEAQALQRAAKAQGEAVKQLLAQRQQERAEVLAAAVQTHRLYRGGLLVQSDATVSSTIAQYQVGKVTFASVLEALAGYVSDYSGFLDSIAQAQRVAIAMRELSLEPVTGAPPAASGAMVGTDSSGAAGASPGM